MFYAITLTSCHIIATKAVFYQEVGQTTVPNLDALDESETPQTDF